MLVTANLQPSLWESVLPAEVRRMSPLLEQIDRWLDDEAFFAPLRGHFSALLGRPSCRLQPRRLRAVRTWPGPTMKRDTARRSPCTPELYPSSSGTPCSPILLDELSCLANRARVPLRIAEPRGRTRRE